MNKTQLYKTLTLLCVLGTAATLIFWYGPGKPYTDLPFQTRMMFLVLLIIPLLLPLQGLLKNNAHTFKWSTLLCLLYFTHAAMESWANSIARTPALIELALSLGWFVFSIAWVRSHRKYS